jgi:hypothetical protein
MWERMLVSLFHPQHLGSMNKIKKIRYNYKVMLISDSITYKFWTTLKRRAFFRGKKSLTSWTLYNRMYGTLISLVNFGMAGVSGLPIIT